MPDIFQCSSYEISFNAAVTKFYFNVIESNLLTLEVLLGLDHQSLDCSQSWRNLSSLTSLQCQYSSATKPRPPKQHTHAKIGESEKHCQRNLAIAFQATLRRKNKSREHRTRSLSKPGTSGETTNVNCTSHVKTPRRSTF